jgi:hypothetical protein
MIPSRTRFDPARLWDALLGLAAALYLGGFLAVIEIALAKLVY